MRNSCPPYEPAKSESFEPRSAWRRKGPRDFRGSVLSLLCRGDACGVRFEVKCFVKCPDSGGANSCVGIHEHDVGLGPRNQLQGAVDSRSEPKVPARIDVAVAEPFDELPCQLGTGVVDDGRREGRTIGVGASKGLQAGPQRNRAAVSDYYNMQRRRLSGCLSAHRTPARTRSMRSQVLPTCVVDERYSAPRQRPAISHGIDPCAVTQNTSSCP